LETVIGNEELKTLVSAEENLMVELYMVLHVTYHFQLSFQVLQCRRLLCLSTHVLAAPNLDDKTHIDVVMQVSYYKKTFAGLCQKLGLRVSCCLANIR